MDNIQANSNLIEALSKAKLHPNDNGSIGVQIILKMIKLNKTKYHTERNLLDTQVGTQEKTNKKDIDAIRSSKRMIQIIKKDVRYLARNLTNFHNFIRILTDLNIDYKKYLGTSDKTRL